MRPFFVFLFFLIIASLGAAAHAANREGGGYARPTYRELVQTMIHMDGADLNDPKIIDEYVRLTSCARYTKYFTDDVAWNRIRKDTAAAIREKKEGFRTLYETRDAYRLGRYDFQDQSFPLIDNTQLVNVGSMVLFSYENYKEYCGGVDLKKTYAFPENINLVLNRPVTATKVKFPREGVEKILARMGENSAAARTLYGRVRFRIIEARLTKQSIDLLGEVESNDLFFDRELTKLAPQAALGR